jgi:hypothetical protein
MKKVFWVQKEKGWKKENKALSLLGQITYAVFGGVCSNIF